MKFFRHRAAAVSLAACLSFIVSGCDQPTAKQQEITPTAVAAPTSDKADATKGNDAELESLVTLNVEELTALALKKL